MKTELISNVSHDLKTPLTSIIAYVDLLKGEEDEEKRKDIPPEQSLPFQSYGTIRCSYIMKW